MRYIPYVLTLKSPAIISELSGDPNSASTMSYIPGASIRGAVAAALGEKDPLFRDLILGGAVAYLNAYPLRGVSRTLPTPVSWRHDRTISRTEERGAFDFAAESHLDMSLEDEVQGPHEKLVRFSEPFVDISQHPPIVMAPSTVAVLHQQRDRKKGRAWKEIATDVTHGAVFTYEAISSGQSFGGIMVLPDDGDALLKRIQEAMPPAILLGRSRSSRYGGLADISWGNPQNREHQFGPSLVTEDISKEQVFRVLLTSDYAGRDNLTGQPDPAALVSELLHALQGKAAVVEGVHGQRVRLGHTVAGGFNRKWGLELPQRHTVRMGSVIVLRARDAISLTFLMQVEDAGIGERKVEGFGRLLFLKDAFFEFNYKRHMPELTKSMPGNPEEAPALVKMIQQRLYYEKLQTALKEAAALIVRDATHLPSNSLIGRLRVPLRKGVAGLTTFRDWLSESDEEHVHEKPLRAPARDQLEKCHLDWDGRKVELMAWLRAFTAPAHVEDDSFRRLLRESATRQQAQILGDDSLAKYSRAIELSLRAQFIDVVLSGMALRSKRQKEKVDQ